MTLQHRKYLLRAGNPLARYRQKINTVTFVPHEGFTIMKKNLFLTLVKIVALFSLVNTTAQADEKVYFNNIELNPREALGLKIFSDRNLSNPIGQSCMTCHNPVSAFADPNKSFPVSLGIVTGRTGGRNAPTAMYMKFAGPLKADKEDDGSIVIEGGYFWDGRANSLEEQAKGPFLNPLEMNETKAGIVRKVCTSRYNHDFKTQFGKDICKPENLEKAYDAVASAIATFERTKVFSPFNSKFDLVMKNKAQFTEAELRGFELFKNEKKANCAACHTLEIENSAQNALFTDFTYDNLGLPSNNSIPSVVESFLSGKSVVDMGLANVTKNDADKGKFKVPTLRNISKTAPYMHNGYFTNLRDVVDFYNTRDSKPICAEKFISAEEAVTKNCWPAPEMAETMNKEELGNLGLTDQEVDDIVTFLKTLDDGYKQ